MFLLCAAAIVGGVATGALTASHGVAAALIAAPFGGSLAALLAGGFVASRSGRQHPDDVALDAMSDTMVAALREVGARAHRAEEAGAAARRAEVPSQRDVA